MQILQSDAEILKWLNIRKKALTAGRTVPISDCPWGRDDGFTKAGCKFEWPVIAIQFYDAKGAGSVLGGDPDDKKMAALVTMQEGSTLLWVREGHEDLLSQIPHNYRLFNVTV